MNDKTDLLEQLKDVELPEVSSALAPGWWLLLLLLILLVFVLFLLKRQHKKRRWHRQAENELDAIRESVGRQPSNKILSRCSELARKVVLAVDSREQVAQLHGLAWLEKLDDVCNRPEFSQGIGQLLLDQPYQKQPAVARKDLDALLDSMQVLVKASRRYTGPST